MWFLILSVFVFNAIFIFMPKKLTPIEILTTCLFAMVLQDTVDIFLDLKYDLYGYFTKGVQWESSLAMLGIYPAFNAIFLNYYQFMKYKTHKFWYIIGCSVFAVVYEWLSIKAGYFYHNGWNLWYSAICYPPLYILLALALKFVRKMVHKSVN